MLLSNGDDGGGVFLISNLCRQCLEAPIAIILLSSEIASCMVSSGGVAFIHLRIVNWRLSIKHQ